ncbi:DUF3857 domain-containing protein [Sphingobacterium paludis]|uniref:Transglutaminase superfamily protein n=1 Tax=Sphingobacterium paludis TaxID=1476465 RepID=A0A4R7CX13_9SPHI|nr:DUF3857 domain-containing protein [Sphingobacterium paludis]TDS12437.1 transglutaminase superfamily protein [Sphingobacterium paludis]
MKYIVISLIALFACRTNAQDFSFGKIKEADFKIQSSLLDSSSSGVVLNEYGYANIELSSIAGKGFEIDYYYHVLIKILNKEGYDQANFTIPLYLDNTEKEAVVDLKGFTYNLESGGINKTALGKENIITEKTSKNHHLVKIAFPQVKEGSIVELRYKTRSPFLFSLNAWTFQTEIPKLRSEFVTRIPDICTYRVNLKGGIPLGQRKVEQYNTQLSTEVGEVKGEKIAYLMTNIPAFVAEDYMTASKNFKSILTFELSRYAIPFGPNKTFSLTWDDVQRYLLDDEKFGGQLKRKSALKEFIDPLGVSELGNHEKATQIYDYIKQQIKWNGRHSMLADVGIKKALESRSGNSADINLALISALNYVGIPAEAVILSTRDNGYPGVYNAGLSEFNYVVARAKVDDAYFYLDASARYEPFGNLPMKCINYQGRNIPLEGVSDWVPLQANLVSSFNVYFNGKIDEEGSLKGKLTMTRGGYGASTKRTVMDGFTSIEEYFEDWQNKMTHMVVADAKVENQGNCEMLLKEEMDIDIMNFATIDKQEIHFNPIVYGRTDKNPFNLSSRTYPVDLGSKIQENLTFLIEVPEGFVLTEESLKMKESLSLPNRDARFIYSITQNGTQVSIQILTQVNKPVFLPEEYLDLKEFFSRIIQRQKGSCVLQHKG